MSTADEIDGGDAKLEIELWDYKLRNHCLVKHNAPRALFAHIAVLHLHLSLHLQRLLYCGHCCLNRYVTQRQ